MVDHCDGDLYLQADEGTDADCVVSTGAFGGVCWRVLGFVDGSEDDPIEMAIAGSARAASAICAGLRVLLEPTRIAVEMHGGTIEATVANRPAEVILLEGAPDDLAAAKRYDLPLIKDVQGESVFAEYVVDRTLAEINVDKTRMYWSQLSN